VRLQVQVRTEARKLAWDSVLRPGRQVVYSLLERAAPELGAELHAAGRGQYGMVPFGFSAPVFASAPRRRGVYTAGGSGQWQLGSPLPVAVEAFGKALSSVPVIAWGAVAFTIGDITLLDAPGFASGRTTFRTCTPVVLKGDGRDEDGKRVTRQDWRLPGEPGWDVVFETNLRRKAATLGLDQDVTLEQVTWVGPKRSFAVAGTRGGGGRKPGACVEVELTGAPETLAALWSWGLGQANSAGFGWVVA
jgi:CRISPR-associated endoribonuclease Cas6